MNVYWHGKMITTYEVEKNTSRHIIHSLKKKTCIPIYSNTWYTPKNRSILVSNCFCSFSPVYVFSIYVYFIYLYNYVHIELTNIIYIFKYSQEISVQVLPRVQSSFTFRLVDLYSMGTYSYFSYRKLQRQAVPCHGSSEGFLLAA